MAMHPILKWAQRSDRLFLTLQLRDITNEKFDITGTHIKFSGQSDKKLYQFEYQLLNEVKKDETKWDKTGFHMRFILVKQKQQFWSRLTKQSKKNAYIQVDWEKWVDQDEQGEDAGKGLGGWDPNSMQGMGGMGGMQGMQGMGGQGDQQDSDQEPQIPHQHNHQNCQGHHHHEQKKQ